LEQVLELAKDYPDRCSLVVDYTDVQRFNLDLAYELSATGRVLKHASEALKGLDLPMIRNLKIFMSASRTADKSEGVT